MLRGQEESGRLRLGRVEIPPHTDGAARTDATSGGCLGVRTTARSRAYLASAGYQGKRILLNSMKYSGRCASADQLEPSVTMIQIPS